jgi:hypothetical protein
VSHPNAIAFDAQIDIQAAAEGQPQSGPPRFAMVGYTGGAMRLAGWRHPVVVDLTGMAIPSQKRPIRMNHDAGMGVGHTERVSIDNGQLVASGVVSRDTPAARDVVAGGRNGFPWQASIGASVQEHEFVREGQSVAVNGRSFIGPINVVRKSVLGEISFVDLGADGDTTASIAAKAAANPKESPVDLAALKTITDKHPAKAGAIVAMAADGKDAEQIAAAIAEELRAEETAAIKAACDQAQADLKAERDAHAKTKEDLAAAIKERDALKAHKAGHSDPGHGKGDVRRSSMDLKAKADFITAHGRAAYEALPE